MRCPALPSKLGSTYLARLSRVAFSHLWWKTGPLAKALCLLLITLIATARAESTQWTISGRAVDSKTSQPLARCTIAIRPTTGTASLASVLTDEDGQFQFQNLPLGKYELTAARRGYLTQSYEGHEDFSTAIAVGPNLKSQGLLFKVTPRAILYGTITDETGDPVRRAQLRLYRDQENQGQRVTQATGLGATTDDRGVYEIPNITPANYYLSVTAQPWYSAAAVGRFQLNQGNAAPRDTIMRVAYPTTWYPNATDTDEATPIPIRGGDRIEADLTVAAQPSVPIRIPLPPGDASGYIAVVTKSVFGQEEQLGFPTVSGPDGFIEITGALSGRYEVTLMHTVDGVPQPATHLTAEVSGGGAQLSSEREDSEVTLTGKVLFAGKPVPTGTILLVATQPRRYYQESVTNDGQFTFRLPPGTYEVVGQLPRMYLASVASPNAPLKGRMVEVKSGAAPILELEAGTGFGRVEGVVERKGVPASAAMVLLAPEDAANNRILFRRDQTDSDGTFTLFNVVPGRYQLLALEDAWDLDWANPTLLKTFLKKSIPVEIHPSEHLQETIQVQSQTQPAKN